MNVLTTRDHGTLYMFTAWEKKSGYTILPKVGLAAWIFEHSYRSTFKRSDTDVG